MQKSELTRGTTASFIRKVMKPIDLSDGTHLPPGTNLLTPLAGIAHDERYFPDPEVFDGLRFWKLRQQQSTSSPTSRPRSPSPSPSSSPSPTPPSPPLLPIGSNKHQFTSISDTNQNFGLGRHACPGRFFAAQEIKLILSYLLLNYDIRLPDHQKTRPEPVVFMMTKSPSQKAEVLFRRREGHR
jgi:cytochrome P450